MVISDNGYHYNCCLFMSSQKSGGLTPYTSSPRDPQSDRMTERCIQSLKSAMKKAAQCNHDVSILLCLTDTPINNFIASPGELLYNRKVASNIPVKCTNHQAKEDETANRFLYSMRENVSVCNSKILINEPLLL